MAAFQAARQANEASNHLFGHDGAGAGKRDSVASKRDSAHPLYASTSVPWATTAAAASQAPPPHQITAAAAAPPFATVTPAATQVSESRAQHQAGLARAASESATGRPDQQADAQAAAIRARARGSALW